jgi:putative NADH-flavin reductase
MNIIVFGATGTVGREIVKQALGKGHHVTAFVRNPEKFTLYENQNLKIHKGDVLNLEDVKKAMHSQDAILCALGDGKIGKIRAEGTKNILLAMNELGVKRLISQSTIGAGDSYENLNFIWKYVMFGFLLKRVLPDHNLQEQYIQRSNLDYTIVRPSALTNGTITDTYKVGFTKDLKKLSLKINRADVADFMLRQISSTDYIRKSISISN